MSLAPIAILVAGAALLAAGVGWLPWHGQADLAHWTGPLLLAAAGLALACFGGWVCWLNVDYFNLRYIYHLTRREIESCADAIVRPDDSGAVYVEIVPRENWSTLTPDRASDGGFVRADSQTGELLFEGVKQRYRIAGFAIASCEVEPINPQAGRGVSYAVVVRAPCQGSVEPPLAAGLAPEFIEAAFLPRGVQFGRTRKPIRQRAAEELANRLRPLMPPPPEAGTAPDTLP